MDSSSLLRAPAVATVLAVLAATAEAAAGSYIPTIDAADFFLWVAANAIVLVIWLLSSYSSRRGRTDDDDSSSWAAAAAAGHDAVDSSIYYTSASEYEAFSDAGRSVHRAAVDAPAPSRRLPPRDREAKAGRRADRPRVRKKPAGHDLVAPNQRAVLAAAAREPDEEIRRNREATLAAFSATATEERPSSRPGGGGGGGGADDDDEDVSMDSLWESIVQRRAARPVVVRKSESWANEELPRLKRVADTAAARREIRKSVSAVSDTASSSVPRRPRPPPSSQSAAEEAPQQAGWRTRDVLVAISPDELLRRAESFIRRQREHLRLQRQESEQRQLQLQSRLHAPALISV